MMRHRFVCSMICLLALVFTSSANGQSSYSHNITSGFRGLIGGSVIELNDGYLCVGRCWFPNDGQGEMLTAILVDKKTGEIKDVDALPDVNSTLSMTGNQLYSVDGVVYIFSEYANELYVFGYEENTGEYIAIDTVKSPSEEIRFGLISLYSFDDEIFEFWGSVNNWETEELDVIRIRYKINDGTSEQRIFYEIPEELFAVSHVETDSSILFLGTAAADRRLLLTEISNEGEQLWSKRFEDLALLKLPRIHVGPDGFVYIPAVQYRPNSSSGRVPTLVKYDIHTREIVWSQIIGIEYYSSYGGIIDNIIPSIVDEDTYLVAAETWWQDSESDSLYAPATVTKISADGDIQWSREYRYYEANGVWHQLTDMEPTSDGNYVCMAEIGWLVEPPDSIEGASFWLFKIDEDGYIVGESGGVSREDEASQIDGVHLWPNPIQSELYINQDDLADVTYSIYATDGQLIERISLQRPYQSVIVAADHWPSGVLTLATTQNGRLLGSQKVVKM